MSGKEYDTDTFEFIAVSGVTVVCCGCGHPLELGERIELVVTGKNSSSEVAFNLIHRDCEWVSE